MTPRPRRHEQGRIPPDIRAVLDRIEADPAARPSLDELADSVHLSASRFKAKFKEQTGIPPAEYLLRRKVEAARRLLAAGQRVTEVAFALGFSSTQYFATAFKRFANLQPREVRPRIAPDA